VFVSSERFLSLGYVSYNALQDFHAFFEEAGDNTGPKTIEDKLFEAEVRRRLLRILSLTLLMAVGLGYSFAVIPRPWPWPLTPRRRQNAYVIHRGR